MGDATFWKNYIHSYDKIFSNLDPYNNLLNFHIKSLLGRKRILDSCAGSGRLSLALLEKGSEAYALDQNESGLKMLESQSGKKRNHLFTYVLDAHKLPFKDNFFDGISSMLAISFMKDPDKYLSEHYRVLAPGGILVISGPSETAKDFEFVGGKWKSELKRKNLFEDLKKNWEIVFEKTRENINQHVYNWFSIKELSDKLKKIGFKVLISKKNPLYYGRGYFIIAQK